jgi:glycosyltransferase involved in cell wall biosynthesis
VYLGWVGQELLAKIYSAADLFVLPSRFDTFGMAVLESISCGLPVVTYLTKGPKDILQDGVNGYLVKTLPAFISAIVAYFRENSLQPVFRKAAVRRSREYKPERIMNNLLADVGLKEDSISGISVAAYD